MKTWAHVPLTTVRAWASLCALRMVMASRAA